MPVSTGYLVNIYMPDRSPTERGIILRQRLPYSLAILEIILGYMMSCLPIPENALLKIEELLLKTPKPLRPQNLARRLIRIQ